MPLKKSAGTLREICLHNIVHNLPSLWSLDYKESNYVDAKFRFLIGPFSELDATSVRDLLKLVVERDCLSRVYLHLLIVPCLKEIDLGGQVKYVSNEIIDMICIRCSNIIKLNIANCSRVSSSHILKFIQNFHSSLRVLGLNGTKTTDKVLEEIGKKCKLVTLEIMVCEQVTRRGLERMFYIDGQKNSVLTPGGDSIRVIDMMGVKIDNEVEFLSKLLKDCRNLRCLTHFALWESILALCKTSLGPVPLRLCGSQNDMSLVLSDYSDDLAYIPIMAKCLPEIRVLSIDHVQGLDLELFGVISRCRKSLRIFKTDWSLPYDFLLYIGALCPNLDTFMLFMTKPIIHLHCLCTVRKYIEDLISENNLTSQETCTWGKLRQLEICWSQLDEFPDLVSCVATMGIIFKSAANLSCIKFTGMPDRDADDLFMSAVQNGHLQNLIELHMTCSPHFTIAPVWEMLMNLPKIQVIDVSDCQQITLAEVLRVESFTRENNYEFKIKYDRFHDV